MAAITVTRPAAVVAAVIAVAFQHFWLRPCEAFLAPPVASAVSHRCLPVHSTSRGSLWAVHEIIDNNYKHNQQSSFCLSSSAAEDVSITSWKVHFWSAVLAASLAVASPPVALAVASPPAALTVVNPSVFTNDYADPLHPLCKRHIEVSRDGTTFHYSGTAVGAKDDPVLRGCSPEEIKEFGIRRGKFDGTIIGDGKLSAGDGVHEGVWEPAYSESRQPFGDTDGIRWNDGNKWTVVKRSWAEQGAEYFFWSYITFSMLAGAKGLYDGIQRKRSESNNM